MDRIAASQKLCQSPSSEVVSREFGHWLDGMAEWQWFATLTFRDPGSKPEPRSYDIQSISKHGNLTILPPAGRPIEKAKRHDKWTRVGWDFAHKALNSLNSALISPLDYQNPIWVACMELQKRGVPHWHALIGNIGRERPLTWVDWWYEHYGIARILPYEKRLGARYYLGKYLAKQMADIRFSPALAVELRRQSQIEQAMVSP
jgi:hypothetical protein